MWTAWFAAGIPIAEGPWKLKGLPGLILKAADDTGSYVFECTNASRTNKKISLTIDDKDLKLISKEDFVKIYVEYFNDPFKDMNVEILSGNSKTFLRQLNPLEQGGI